MFDEVPKNCQYGYARVSSKSQEENSSLESQLDRGVPEKNIRIEIGSAADKPVFYHLIDEDDYTYDEDDYTYDDDDYTYHYKYHYTY
jgi:hypothetical protein